MTLTELRERAERDVADGWVGSYFNPSLIAALCRALEAAMRVCALEHRDDDDAELIAARTAAVNESLALDALLVGSDAD